MSGMFQEIELLVHAGAPSSRRNDDRYKAQAQAYLGFQGRRLDLEPIQTPLDDRDDEGLPGVRVSSQTCSLSQSIEVAQADRVETQNVEFVENTLQATSALESQLWTSSMLDNPGQVRAIAERGSTDPLVLSSPKGFHVPPFSHEPQNSPLGSFRGRRNGSKDGSCSSPASISASQADASRHSSYLESPLLERTVKKRKLDSRSYLQSESPCHNNNHGPMNTSSNSDSSLVPNKPQHKIKEDHLVVVDEVDSQRPVASNETTSELPTSYSLSDVTSGSVSNERRVQNIVGMSDNQASSVGQDQIAQQAETFTIIGAVSSTTGATSQHTEHSRIKDRTSMFTEPAQTHTALARAEHTEREFTYHGSKVTREEHHGKAGTVIPQTQPPEPPALESLPLSIQPPDPPISKSPFKTHVTEALRFLAEESAAAKSYKPILVVRELLLLERGYWLIPTLSWPSQLQLDFWIFLSKMIKSGDAGWGVWCTREQDGCRARLGEHDERDGKGEASQKLLSASAASGPTALGLGNVKVFCWGEVVKHVYVLLYVASKAQVRKLGLEWIDARGIAVLQMRRSE